MPGIEKVHEMVIQGVTISDWVGFEEDIDKICCIVRQSMCFSRQQSTWSTTAWCCPSYYSMSTPFGGNWSMMGNSITLMVL